MNKLTYFIFTFILLFTLASCGEYQHQEPTSNSGVSQAKVEIETGSDGLSMEQRNISRRLKVDNEIGSIKHLYVISAFSGEVIIYSTVDGKVTSGGKRLTPTSVTPLGEWNRTIPIMISGQERQTGEVIQDDGTYGSSMNYLYWFDVKGNYHQHYVNGGQIVHISDVALPVGEITINISE